MVFHTLYNSIYVTDCSIGVFHQVIVVLEYIMAFNYLSGEDSYPYYPLCLILSGTYYGKGYAGIISLGLMVHQGKYAGIQCFCYNVSTNHFGHST